MKNVALNDEIFNLREERTSLCELKNEIHVIKSELKVNNLAIHNELIL